jgi:hypothetical protein
MALTIQTTGLEQYAPGGAARVKVLVIGGPGAGKTRWASYFPRPIYADTERGLASVADRQVPFVNINTSGDMLELLEHLKFECRKPMESRQFDTVVIDTLDAFQRKLKTEWMEVNKKQTFTGWEAWGFLNAKLQLLMTRLLNLDMNVVINVHYKTKKSVDDESGASSEELMLQLQGEMADLIFNDFDLVGWMGTYWEAEQGTRVEKRGLTFTRTPDKPFLKDRFHVTPKWLPVLFDGQDYEGLFSRISEKAASLSAGEQVGQIAAATDPATVAPAGVVTVDQATSGPLPEQPRSKLPLDQLDKPTLVKLARDEGVTTLPDGSPIRGNTLKSELIAAVEAHRQKAAPPAPEVKTAEPAPAPDKPSVFEPEQQQREAAPAKPATDAPAAALTRARGKTVNTEAGEVDTSTGEVVTKDEAIATVEKTLGGQVVAEIDTTPEPAPEKKAAPKAAAPTGGTVCDECGKDITGEPPTVAKLSRIKFKKTLCEADYAKRKAA